MSGASLSKSVVYRWRSFSMQQAHRKVRQVSRSSEIKNGKIQCFAKGKNYAKVQDNAQNYQLLSLYATLLNLIFFFFNFFLYNTLINPNNSVISIEGTITR